MAWVRIHDGAMTHPKLVGLVDWKNPFCVWVWGLSHCQQHLTNGKILRTSLQSRAALKAAEQLVLNKLWDVDADGNFTVHDYLDWNDSRAAVLEARQLAKARMVLVRDPGMREALRQRDQDLCRYCRVLVNWADRKSRAGATYDHIDPHGLSTLENLVIACRGCNSKKQKRTPEEAGMVLLPPPSVSRFQPTRSTVVTVGLDRVSSTASERTEEEKLQERAGRLREELYPAWFAKYLNGARLRLVANSLEYQDALSLVALWDDARLEKLAALVLTTDDEWISKTDRGFRIFALKASWADQKLSEWEAAHGQESA